MKKRQIKKNTKKALKFFFISLSILATSCVGPISGSKYTVQNGKLTNDNEAINSVIVLGRDMAEEKGK